MAMHGMQACSHETKLTPPLQSVIRPSPIHPSRQTITFRLRARVCGYSSFALSKAMNAVQKRNRQTDRQTGQGRADTKPG
mmetsp:Transcript_23583/g.67749  ORF Transcript_23583/g.67749 Transcript_23583/m.67749 type:complete len:80 (+) Transcript_23583:415-654(+)